MIIAGPLVAALIAYASLVSGLPIPANAPLPQITTDTHTPDGEPLVDHGAGIAGVTFQGKDGLPEIRLHPKWSAKNPEDDCVLAHELTHYLQLVNHVQPMTCETAEPPAYAVTARCFQDRHLPTNAVAWALEKSARPPCGGEHHHG